VCIWLIPVLKEIPLGEEGYFFWRATWDSNPGHSA
jgi:hypothetical protein